MEWDGVDGLCSSQCRYVMLYYVLFTVSFHVSRFHVSRFLNHSKSSQVGGVILDHLEICGIWTSMKIDELQFYLVLFFPSRAVQFFWKQRSRPRLPALLVESC